MKTIARDKTIKEGTSHSYAPNNSKEIKSDFPLSEKDEVKQAEEKMRKAAKKKRML